MRKLTSQKYVHGVILACCLSVCWLTGALGQARIEFQETEFDFGRLLEGETATHTFHLRNTGSSPLRISEVKTTCGCTAALVTDSLFSPGERGQIKVTFDSKGRMGHQNRTVSVITNDPDQPNASLVITGEVFVLVRASPHSLNFGDVSMGKSKTMNVTVTPWGATQFEIIRLEPPGDYFEVRSVDASGSWRGALASVRDRIVAKFTDPRARVQDDAASDAERLAELGGDLENEKIVSVTLLPSAPLGLHSGRLGIHTNVPEKPLLEVPVYASVVGDLEVTPKRYNLGVVRRAEGKEGAVNISSRTNAPFKIIDVKSSSKHTNVEWSTVSPGTEYQVKLKVLPGAPVGQLQGAVTVSTTDRDEPEVVLRFYAKISE